MSADALKKRRAIGGLVMFDFERVHQLARLTPNFAKPYLLDEAC